MPDTERRLDQQQLEAINFLWLELTNSCNLECTHCYSDSNPEKAVLGSITEQDWIKTLKEAEELGCRKVQFIGGEPTMHPSLNRLIEAADDLGYEYIEVFTNGSLLNDRRLDELERHNVRLAFSMYGSNAQVHDSITRRKGSFERTFKAINNATRRGLEVRVGIVGMPENKDDIEATKELLQKAGVEKVSDDYVRGIGRGETYITDIGNPKDELCGWCWNAKLVVDPDGTVYPCVLSRAYPMGNITEGLGEILSSERLWDFRQEIFAKKYEGPCGSCVPDSCKPDCIPVEDPGPCYAPKNKEEQLLH